MTSTAPAPTSRPALPVLEPDPTPVGTIDRPPNRAAGTGPPTELVVPHLSEERPLPRWALLALRFIMPLSLVLLWWVGTDRGWIDDQTFAAPGTVATAFWDLLTSGELWANLSVSLTRSITGLVIGLALGLGLGLLAGLSRVADGLIDPLMQIGYTIPFLAVAPLLVVWFGIGELPKIVLITVAVCLPVYLNTFNGVRNTDPKIVEAARVFGVSRTRLVRQIIVPGALPTILVGLRIALSLSLLALIVVEQTNSPKGIGFLMLSAQQYFQTEILIVCILIYAVWGLTAGALVRGLSWLLQPWRRKENVR